MIDAFEMNSIQFKSFRSDNRIHLLFLNHVCWG